MATNDAYALRMQGENMLDGATRALDAVRDLCCEAANGQLGHGLAHTNADNFAFLLGLIIAEMQAGSELLQEARDAERGR